MRKQEKPCKQTQETKKNWRYRNKISVVSTYGQTGPEMTISSRMLLSRLLAIAPSSKRGLRRAAATDKHYGIVPSTNVGNPGPDGHKSSYKVDWLWQNVFSGYKDACRVKKNLWSGGLDSVTVHEDMVQFNDYMNSNEALKTVLKSLVTRGFAIIQNVPTTMEDTQRAAERICPLRLGFFGKVLEFQDHMLHRKNPTLPNRIIPHTDQSYLTEPAGVKIIHCTENNAKMRVNLVDGFNIAAELKKKDAEAYNTLSELPVLFEYTDDAFHHKCPDVILKHDALTGNLLQIKYNMYYRSALSTIPFEDMDRFYTALHAISQLIQNSFQFCRVQPKTGTMILMDNWRILSSTSQSTQSKLIGCYLGWSDYMCTARQLQIVP